MKTENKCKNRYANILACKYAFIDQATFLGFRKTLMPLWSHKGKFITCSAYYFVSFFVFVLLLRLNCYFWHFNGSKYSISKLKDSRIRTQELNPCNKKFKVGRSKQSQLLPVYWETKTDGARMITGAIAGCWLQNVKDFLGYVMYSKNSRASVNLKPLRH